MYLLPDFTDPAQAADASLYKGAIDESVSVHDNIAGAFYVYEAATPDMTVVINAGKIQDGTTLTNVAQQTTAAFVAPTTDPRIDRIVIDQSTGLYSVITGTEAASPSEPAVSSGKIIIADVTLQTTTTVITNSMITDRRSFNYLQPPSLLTKVINIGDWDMDASLSAAIPHGLTYADIIDVAVTIRDDTDARRAPLWWDSGTLEGGYFEINTTNIVLSRIAGGVFDSLDYNATGYNRGWLIINYTA